MRLYALSFPSNKTDSANDEILHFYHAIFILCLWNCLICPEQKIQSEHKLGRKYLFVALADVPLVHCCRYIISAKNPLHINWKWPCVFSIHWSDSHPRWIPFVWKANIYRMPVLPLSMIRNQYQPYVLHRIRFLNTFENYLFSKNITSRIFNSGSVWDIHQTSQKQGSVTE